MVLIIIVIYVGPVYYLRSTYLLLVTAYEILFYL